MPAEVRGVVPPEILKVEDLRVHFPVRKGLLRRTVGQVRAVDGVTFSVRRGETLGLVGESGCGKTTTGRSILQASRPTGGRILYRPAVGPEVDVASARGRRLKELRREMRFIFQDPYGSLNPRMTLLDIVGEPLRAHGIAKGRQLEERVAGLLSQVGLRAEYLRRYPHAFSGGERQRIGIARALATAPRLVVADEAVSALDVSIRAQILNLLEDLRAQLDLTYIFISHDLSVVEYVSDRVAVMYLGKIVEVAKTRELYANPLMPYTEALLSAVPRPDPDLRGRSARIVLQGEVPDPANPPSGCSFHPRCPYARQRCASERPVLREVRPAHLAACHFAEELLLRGVAPPENHPP